MTATRPPEVPVGGRRARPRRTARVWLGVLLLLAAATTAVAEDWPTLGHDNHRSHVTGERLALPLRPLWTHAAARPQTAWPGPAKWDAYAALMDLAPMRDFDLASFTIAVGSKVWYGSSADDSVHCLDAATGHEEWTFTTDGPVRLPPAWDAGRLYVGSDDGRVYCLDADRGALHWSYKPPAADRLLPVDGKLISTWPVRTGVLVAQGRACFGASLLPWNPSYLVALDAGTGQPVYCVEHAALTLQGPLVASSDRLFLSQGRLPPVVCELLTGRLVGPLGSSGNGGVWGLLVDDSLYVHGRGQNHGTDGELRGVDPAGREVFATFPKARHLAAAADAIYLLGGGTLTAWDRQRYLGLQREQSALLKAKATAEKRLKDLGSQGAPELVTGLRAELAAAATRGKELAQALPQCVRWQVQTPCQHSLILTATALFTGGEGTVVAFSPADGSRLWEAPVDGQAHGLAAAHGRLLVSTDTGVIQAFGGAAMAPGPDAPATQR